MDDFDGRGQACREIKNICDKTPCIVETKGGQVNLRNQLVVITSNRDPRMWYGEKEEAIDASAVLERCLFFRVEECLVVNAGRRDGFGLNETGEALRQLIRRAIAAEENEGEGASGFRGEAALKSQETRYGMYGAQIAPIARPPLLVVGAEENVDGTMDNAFIVVESDNEEGYEVRAAKRARTD